MTKRTKPAVALSPLDGAILGLLHNTPMSGYDLRKIFSSTPLRHFSDSPGSIYPALRRLHRLSWTTKSLDHEKALRPREVYALTASGRAALNQHLDAPPTAQEVADHIDRLFLRFVFMLELRGAQRTVRFLEKLQAEIENYLTELKAFRDSSLDKRSIAPGLTLQHGIDTYELHRDWCRRSIQILKKAEES